MPGGQTPASRARHKPSAAQLRVILACGTGYGVSADALLAPGRGAAEASRARQAAMWCLALLWPQLSKNRISIFLNRGEHSTVVYGLRKAARLHASDSLFREVCRIGLAARREGDSVMPPAVAAAITQRSDEVQAMRLLAEETDRAMALAEESAGLEPIDEQGRPRVKPLADVGEWWPGVITGTRNLLQAMRVAHPERFARGDFPARGIAA